MKMLFLIRIYCVMSSLFFHFNYALQKKVMKNDSVYYETNRTIAIFHIEFYFPKVIANIIEEYRDPQTVFFDLWKTCKQGICYSSFNNTTDQQDIHYEFNSIVIRNGKQYRCLYNPQTRSLELSTGEIKNNRVLMQPVDHLMHNYFVDTFSIQFAMPNDDIVFIKLYLFLYDPKNSLSCLLFPLENDQKKSSFKLVKNVRYTELDFFLQTDQQLLLFHSFDYGQMMTRILLSKNKKPNIKSYYLPYANQSYYKVTKYSDQKNIFFIFGKNKNETKKFYIIFSAFGYAPLCAEFPCSYVAPSEIQHDSIIGRNDFSHTDFTLQDYFIKNREPITMKPCMYTLKSCGINYFTCVDND